VDGSPSAGVGIDNGDGGGDVRDADGEHNDVLCGNIGSNMLP
jgi:hypothetical protein